MVLRYGPTPEHHFFPPPSDQESLEKALNAEAKAIVKSEMSLKIREMESKPSIPLIKGLGAGRVWREREGLFVD